jgi:hypothetical protein
MTIFPRPTVITLKIQRVGSCEILYPPSPDLLTAVFYFHPSSGIFYIFLTLNSPCCNTCLQDGQEERQSHLELRYFNVLPERRSTVCVPCITNTRQNHLMPDVEQKKERVK